MIARDGKAGGHVVGCEKEDGMGWEGDGNEKQFRRKIMKGTTRNRVRDGEGDEYWDAVRKRMSWGEKQKFRSWRSGTEQQ